MRFMVMHKVDDVIESGGPPSQRIIEQMGELVGESMKSGVCLDGAGLHRSARRVRITSPGEAVRGPYSGDNELVASMTMIKASSVDDAIEKLQYDLYHVKNHSLFLDIMILIATVEVVLWGRGAR